MITSRSVPGYEVDSLITKVSFETNGAIPLLHYAVAQGLDRVFRQAELAHKLL